MTREMLLKAETSTPAATEGLTESLTSISSTMVGAPQHQQLTAIPAGKQGYFPYVD